MLCPSPRVFCLVMKYCIAQTFQSFTAPRKAHTRKHICSQDKLVLKNQELKTRKAKLAHKTQSTTQISLIDACQYECFCQISHHVNQEDKRTEKEEVLLFNWQEQLLLASNKALYIDYNNSKLNFFFFFNSFVHRPLSDAVP